MTSARRQALVGFAAILPVIAQALVKMLLRPKPFWAHDYDPETIYFYESLRLLGGHAPRNVDHPGTTLQLLGVPIALFTGAGPLHFEMFRAAAYTVALLLIVGSAVFLAVSLFRDAAPWIAVLGVWSYFLTPMALERDLIWSAEILYFPLAALIVATAVRALRDGATARESIVAGAAVGLAIATKFLFLGWAVALLVTARRRAAALAGIACGFVVMTLVAARKYPYMFGWIWQNASRSGPYGRGELAPPDLGETARAYAQSLWTAKGWLLWVAVVAVLLWLGRRGVDRRIVLFALIGGLLSYAAPFRNPVFRYLLPAGVAVIALVYAARLAPRAASIAACAVAALLLGKSLLEDLRAHEAKIAAHTALRREIDDAVQRLAPGGVVVYGWRVPEPSFALRVMTENPRYLEMIARRYPREGHFNDWLGRVFLPPGATRWDALVIDPALAGRFPEPLGAPAAAAGPYRIYTPLR